MNTELTRLIAAARDCLHAIKLMDRVRPAVRDSAMDYERCVDLTLSQQFELLSGLMNEYGRTCPGFLNSYFDFGPEPLSYQDAVVQFPAFLAAVSTLFDALPDDSYAQWAALPSVTIEIRAFTFACQFKAATA